MEASPLSAKPVRSAIGATVSLSPQHSRSLHRRDTDRLRLNKLQNKFSLKNKVKVLSAATAHLCPDQHQTEGSV